MLGKRKRTYEEIAFANQKHLFFDGLVRAFGVELGCLWLKVNHFVEFSGSNRYLSKESTIYISLNNHSSCKSLIFPPRIRVKVSA